MFSSLTERGAAATLDALLLGANDYVPKPTHVNSFEALQQCICDEVIPRIKQLAIAAATRAAKPVPDAAEPRTPRGGRAARVEILVIGASTGGPAALARLLPSFVPRMFCSRGHRPAHAARVHTAPGRSSGRDRPLAGAGGRRRTDAVQRRSLHCTRRIAYGAGAQRRADSAAVE